MLKLDKQYKKGAMKNEEKLVKQQLNIDNTMLFMEQFRMLVSEIVQDVSRKEVIQIEEIIKREVTPLKEAMNEMLTEKEYTIQEVATITGKHHKTIRNWIDQKDLEAYKLGKVWMIKHSKLEEFKNMRLDKDPHDKIFKLI